MDTGSHSIVLRSECRSFCYSFGQSPEEFRRNDSVPHHDCSYVSIDWSSIIIITILESNRTDSRYNIFHRISCGNCIDFEYWIFPLCLYCLLDNTDSFRSMVMG